MVIKNSKTSLKILSTTLASVMFFNSNFAGATEPVDKSKKPSFGSGFLTGMTVASIISALGAMAAYKYLDPKAKDKEYQQLQAQYKELENKFGKKSNECSSLEDQKNKIATKLKGLIENQTRIQVMFLADEFEKFATDPSNQVSEDYKTLKECIVLTETKGNETPESKIRCVIYSLYKYINAHDGAQADTRFINCFEEEPEDKEQKRGYYIAKEKQQLFLEKFNKILNALFKSLNETNPRTLYQQILLNCLKKTFKLNPQQ